MTGLFVGVSTLDILNYCHTYPIEDQKLYADEQLIVPGGMAANAAITYAALGGEAHLFSCIDYSSPFGGQLAEQMAQFGVKLSDCAGADFPGVPVASIVINQVNGSRTIVNRPKQLVECPLDTITDFPDFDILLIDGFYPDLAIAAIAQAKEKKIPIVMDSGSWKVGMEELLKEADILIVSAHFRPPGTTSDQEAWEYLSKYDFRAMVVTNGADAVRVREGELAYQLRPAQVKSLDTLAAGDILHGAFCWYYSLGQDFRQSLELAMQVASRSCEYNGPHTWIAEL